VHPRFLIFKYSCVSTIHSEGTLVSHFFAKPGPHWQKHHCIASSVEAASQSCLSRCLRSQTRWLGLLMIGAALAWDGFSSLRPAWPPSLWGCPGVWMSGLATVRTQRYHTNGTYTKISHKRYVHHISHKRYVSTDITYIYLYIIYTLSKTVYIYIYLCIYWAKLYIYTLYIHGAKLHIYNFIYIFV